MSAQAGAPRACSHAVTAAVAAAAWNNVLHATPTRWRRTAVDLGTGAAVAAGSMWLRAETAALDTRPRDLRYGVATAGAATAVVVAARRSSYLAELLGDRRMAAMSPRRFLVQTCLRIPLLSGLGEEIIFRGVVWELLARAGDNRSATVGSGVAFAASHLAVAREQAAREAHDVATWVGATLATTFVAGIALGWLRRVTGGVWAPAGVHTAVNVVLAVAGRRFGAAAVQ